jgi:hypothetical protein
MPKFVANAEFNKNQALNMLLQMIAGNHGSPVEALIWYDSTAKAIKYHDGTTIQTLGVAGVGGDAATLDGLDSLYFLARANHTGTQLAATISDLAAVVQAYRLDQFAAPNTSLNANNQKIISLANGTAAGDAVNLGQLQAASAGLAPKDSVRAASTANVNIASPGATFDGVTIAGGDSAQRKRVLLKDQSTASQNGIYDWTGAATPMTRSTDADSEDDLLGALVSVQEGTANGNSLWMMTTDGPITVGTTGLSWTQFLSGIAYTWGGGIGISGSTVSITAGTGLTQDTDGLSLTIPVVLTSGGTGATTAAAARTNLGTPGRFAANIGNGSLTTLPVTHNLGTTDVIVQVYRANAQIWPDINIVDGNSINCVYSVAPAASDRVVVIG